MVVGPPGRERRRSRAGPVDPDPSRRSSPGVADTGAAATDRPAVVPDSFRCSPDRHCRVHVRIYTPVESVLAGRVVEVVRSTVPDAETTLTTDPSTYVAVGDRSDRAGEPVSVVLVDSESPAAVFEASSPTLALVAAGGDGDGVDLGTIAGAAAAGGLVGLLLGGLLGDDGEPPFGGELL